MCNEITDHIIKIYVEKLHSEDGRVVSIEFICYL